jgi:hypothetical protein
MTERKSWVTGDIFMSASGDSTLSAWEPWEETRWALFELQNSDIDDEHPEWRRNWIVGVAMLRTVGHVLHKVDAATSPRHKSVIHTAWQSWNSDKDGDWIFFDFIEKERNNILKMFSSGAQLPSAEDGRLLAYGNTDLDAAELFREAVYWWRFQLRLIESQLL